MALFEQPVFIQPTHTPHLCQFFGLTVQRQQIFGPVSPMSSENGLLKKDNKKLDRHGTVAAKACLGLGYKAREKGPWSEL